MSWPHGHRARLRRNRRLVALCVPILVVTALACGRYGPPRWTAGSTIPTAPVQSDPGEISIDPNPEMQETTGGSAPTADSDVDNEEAEPEANTP